MDFALTEEQNELRELARKILEDRATDARLREIARSDERIDRELWRELARANLLGVAVAEEYGGSGNKGQAQKTCGKCPRVATALYGRCSRRWPALHVVRREGLDSPCE